MSLLLCKREAENPFYIEKLDIRLWSMQELCYVIYNHPLLAAEDLRDSEEFCRWLREDAAQGFLAAKIEQIRAAAKSEDRDPTDELMLAVLRDCNYYAPGEIEACRRRLQTYQECQPEDRAHAEGVSLFRLRRYRMAEERFRTEEMLLRERAERLRPGQEQEALRRRISETLCDLAVIRLHLFEKEEAKALLREAGQTADCRRAARLFYLLEDTENGQAADLMEMLTDEEKSGLDRKREEARLHALSGGRMQAVSRLFEQDPVKRGTACTELLRKWKKEYRRMR